MKFDIARIISSEQTGGAMAAFAENVAPGSGPPLHAHRSQTEVFHVIQGTFLFQKEGQQVTLGPGGCIAIPRGAVHSFKNVGPEAGRLHFELLPAENAEAFFRRLVKEGSEIEDLAGFFSDYGIDLLGPPL